MVQTEDGKDYFVEEPALARSREEILPVYPVQWFLQEDSFFAVMHWLYGHPDKPRTYMIDA